MKPPIALVICFCTSLAAAWAAAWVAAFWTCWPMASMVLFNPPRLCVLWAAAANVEKRRKMLG